MMSAISVAQALYALRTALDNVDKCLDRRDFEEAVNLGNSDVLLVFLQRTLGTVKSSQLEKQKIIQTIATQTASYYEDAVPFIE